MITTKVNAKIKVHNINRSIEIFKACTNNLNKTLKNNKNILFNIIKMYKNMTHVTYC